MKDSNIAPLRVTERSKQLAPVGLDLAVKRVRAYCTNLASGWSAYDLAGIHARRQGHFEQVSAWDILLAGLMNARPTLKEVILFDVSQRERFAQRVAAVPAKLPLADMNDAQLRSVAELCAFGFRGAWGPTVTKVAALYRPDAVPILDGHLSVIFGFGSDGFTRKGTRREPSRTERITIALDELRSALNDQRDWISALREAVIDLPGTDSVSDIRLLDIVLWTSWDDERGYRDNERPRTLWQDCCEGKPISLDSMRPVPIPGPTTCNERSERPGQTLR